ncbi:MAG: complex I NDUFA9 subunit family protein [Nitrospirae bacterium]|nr:complex I NDUFA9 subunit family protein [Nitrospirota bacterium]
MIFIAGASGFAGGHLTEHLLKSGREIKVLLRSSPEAKFLREGVRIIRGDITKPETLKGALSSDDLVVHLVGIIEEKGGSTFQKVHVEGTRNLLDEARSAGVRHFFYQSALGADINSWSGYLRTKAAAEEMVKESGLRYTIFRPSLIIGPWDGFTKMIVGMLKVSPVLPIPGDGMAKFQPIYVNDWLKCIEKVIDHPELYQSVYELGGPEHIPYHELVGLIAEVSGHKRPELNIPMGLMKFGAALLGGLTSSPPVTSDQLRLLEQDNVTEPGAVKRDFGFEPMRIKDALKEFLR